MQIHQFVSSLQIDKITMLSLAVDYNGCFRVKFESYDVQVLKPKTFERMWTEGLII